MYLLGMGYTWFGVGMLGKEKNVDREAEARKRSLRSFAWVAGGTFIFFLSLTLIYVGTVSFVVDRNILFKIVWVCVLSGIDFAAARELWRRLRDLKKLG